MSLAEKMVSAAKAMVESGYNPPVRPGCAAFVWEVMKRAGWTKQVDNPYYVPNLVPLGSKVSTPLPGDLIIFKQTYDAVAPAGVGAEDDMTHIGVWLGNDTFAHFSSSADRPVTGVLSGSWTSYLQMFVRLPDASVKPAPVKPKEHMVKIFYNKPDTMPTIIIDGKEDSIEEMLTTIRTVTGQEIVINSHHYQHNPYMRVNGLNDSCKGAVTSIESYYKFS